MLDFHEPAYPLASDVFLDALGKGLGRALVHAERFGAEIFRAEILAHASAPEFYDTQVNGHGEWWLARLCETAGLVDEILTLSAGEVHPAQRGRLLKELFLLGHSEALPALYEIGRSIDGYDLEDVCEAIVEADGERGLVFAAGKLSQRLERDPEFWAGTALASLYDEGREDGSAMAVLLEAGKTDPLIARYAAAVRFCGESEMTGHEPSSDGSCEDAIDFIRTATISVYRVSGWGHRAAEVDRMRVMEMDLEKLPTVALENFLCYFSRTGFPKIEPRLVALLDHPCPSVREAAQTVFSHHPEALIREAALKALGTGDMIGFLTLLESSAKPEDATLISQTIKKVVIDDDNHLHAIIVAALKIIENKAWVDISVPLWIYHQSPCMLCRRSAVEVMLRNGNCPAWVLEECLRDSSAALRALARESISVPLSPPEAGNLSP